MSPDARFRSATASPASTSRSAPSLTLDIDRDPLDGVVAVAARVRPRLERLGFPCAVGGASQDHGAAAAAEGHLRRPRPPGERLGLACETGDLPRPAAVARNLDAGDTGGPRPREATDADGAPDPRALARRDDQR